MDRDLGSRRRARRSGAGRCGSRGGAAGSARRAGSTRRAGRRRDQHRPAREQAPRRRHRRAAGLDAALVELPDLAPPLARPEVRLGDVPERRGAGPGHRDRVDGRGLPTLGSRGCVSCRTGDGTRGRGAQVGAVSCRQGRAAAHRCGPARQARERVRRRRTGQGRGSGDRSEQEHGGHQRAGELLLAGEDAGDAPGHRRAPHGRGQLDDRGERELRPGDPGDAGAQRDQDRIAHVPGPQVRQRRGRVADGACQRSRHPDEQQQQHGQRGQRLDPPHLSRPGECWRPCCCRSCRRRAPRRWLRRGR